MDTRFWGPSGWKLLHRIAHAYRPHDAPLYAAFFETLPYILPCKFCRASLTDYYRLHPFSPEGDIQQWMYTIHNRVNDKLRQQGLHPDPNPPYRKVVTLQDAIAVTPWEQQLTGFWDFLFSVGYHHPKEKQLYATPMPDCPPEAKRTSDACERNKWNTLPLRARLTWFRRFWRFLPAVLPLPIAHHWSAAQQKHPPTLSSRHTTLAWLWRMRCELETEFHDPYHSICKRMATYASDCTSRRGAFTCRSKANKRRKASKRSKASKASKESKKRKAIRSHKKKRTPQKRTTKRKG